jgi:pyrroline-5-carboxylate reductase
MTRLGIIGTGSLGTALLRAAATHAPDIALIVSSRDPSRVETLRREIPALTAAAPEELAKTADLVLLCVPPAVYLGLLERIAGHFGPSAILVSVTNSVSLEAIASRVSVPVVKAIPTLAHVVGRGNALLCAGPRALPEHVEAVKRVFARFSRPVTIDPRDDRVASNVAGSALALFAAMCGAFVDANAQRARTLDVTALNVMMAETLAAIASLAQAGHTWNDIVRTTATPGGMTEAALDRLMSRFPQIANEMVTATFDRQTQIQGIGAAAQEVRHVRS